MLSDKTAVTFDACNLNSLNELFEKYPNEIACVITEPEKNTCIYNCDCESSPGFFLKSAIELCEKNWSVFILDEMQSGYRAGFPGSISKYSLKPHLSTWGKGIANGFSFCALTGKKEIMELGGIKQKTSERVF